MSNYVDAIISGIFALLGVILGFLLQSAAGHYSERKRLKQEFSTIKNSIYSTTLTNNLFPELLKLKQFLVRNEKYMKRKENKLFFEKWLRHPLVEQGFTGSGYWDQTNIKEMVADLDKTRA